MAKQTVVEKEPSAPVRRLVAKYLSYQMPNLMAAVYVIGRCGLVAVVESDTNKLLLYCEKNRK